MATPVVKGFMVAAIDLGTTYSSHAFSFKSDYVRDPLQIHTENWHVASNLSHKTSSVLLLNPDTSFNSFGFEAENKFTDMAEDESEKNDLEKYYYVDSFKMILYQDTAGIPDDALSLAYEPEVAALFCKQLQVDQVSGAKSDIFQEGAGIMVVDLGGGTADITVQEVSGNKMRSTFTVSGGPWGGARVNAEFISFLIETFGNEVIRKLKRKQTGEFLELIREFEVKKRNTDILKKGKDLIIRLPLALLELYKEFNDKAYENTSKFVTVKKDKMHIKPFKFDSFFCKTISSITEHLKSLLDGNNISVSTILMVGGFSECKLVSDAIKKEFPRHHVVIPMECGLSVLKGAVLYGHRPESITARYCHYSIGISLNKLYDPKEHVGATTFKSGQTVKCGSCFETFFCKGRIVEVGEKETVEVHSDHRTRDRELLKNDVKEIEIYTSKKSSPKFVTEAGCNRHAIITIDPPEGGWPEVVDGKIEMEVGGTEVIVRYIDLISQESTVVKLDSLTCFGE